MKRVGALAAALLAALGAACVQAQDVRGTVFEVTDPGAVKVPSANAFVIVHWTGRRPGLGHYESVCIQAAIGRTDAQGRFAIAEPPPLRSTFLVFRNDPAVAVWKPGYDEQSRKAGEWTLEPTKASAEMRRAMADGLGSYGCSDDRGWLLPLTDPGWDVRILQRQGPSPASR